MTSTPGHVTPASPASVPPQVVTYVQLVEVDPRLQQQQQQQGTAPPLPPQRVSQHQQQGQAHQQMAYALREDPPIALWKRQLRDRSYATCVHPACSISFLTLPGILAHHKGCVGVATASDYLPCNQCGLRFKQFKSLKSHQDREHEAPPPGPILVKGVQYVPVNTVGRQGSFSTYRPILPARDYSRTAEPSATMPVRTAIQRLDDSSTPYAETMYMPKELEDELEGPSTTDTSTPETAARILAESKRISNARPRGRPRRNYQHPAEPPPRVVDVFDIGFPEPVLHPTQQTPLPVAQPCRMVQVQPMGESLLIVGQGSQGAASLPQDHPRPPPPQSTLQRPSQPNPLNSQLVVQLPAEATSTTPFLNVGRTPSRTSSPAASSVSRHSLERPSVVAPTSSGDAAAADPATQSVGEDGELDAKERELSDKEAKLRDYERIVLQSEEMAKKAARAEKAAELAEREKRIQEKELELRQRLAQAVQVLEETRTTPPTAMTPPPPPPPPAMPPRIPSVTPPAEPTSTGQIDESDSALSNDETSSVITTTSRTSREQVSSEPGGNLKSPKISQRQEDPGDDNQLINPNDVVRRNLSPPSPRILTQADSNSTLSDPKPEDAELGAEHSRVSFKVIATASGSGAVQAGEEVAHILSDDIEIADPADLIEISTEGITEAVVLERSVDVVVAGASHRHQNVASPPSGDMATKDQVTITANEEVLPKRETPRRSCTPKTRRALSISKKMNTRAQSLYEATVEAAKDMTSSESSVNTRQKASKIAGTSCGASDIILPDQILSETDEDIAASFHTPPVTRMRQTLSQPHGKDAGDASSNYISEEMRKPSNGNCRTRGQTQRHEEDETRKWRLRTATNETIVGSQNTRETLKAGKTPSPTRKDKRVRKRLPCQEVKQESAVELIHDLDEMPTGEPMTKRRRGRRRRCQEPSTDSDDLPTSTSVAETPAKPEGRNRRGRKSNGPSDQIESRPSNFECGKCAMTSKTNHDFVVHAAVHHGGLARKRGESQEFTEDEIQAAIRLSFMRSPTVSCYRCVSRKFTSHIGLNYHLTTCGKTKEELEAAKTPCPVRGCGYRGFPQNLRQHQNVHQKDELKEKERQRKIEKLLAESEDPNDDATDGSRSRRRAAKRAQARLSEAIAELKNKEDDVDIKDVGDDDDDAYVAANEADLEGRYDVKKSEDGRKRFHCSLCDFVGDHKAEVESHLVSEHAGYLAGDADDDFNDDEDEDVSDEERDVDFGDDEDDSSCFGEELHVPKKKSTSHSRAKPSTLEPVVDYFFYERAFRRDNFGQRCFEELNTTAAEWKTVKSDAEKAKFLPDDDKSPNFSFQPSHTKSPLQKPQRMSLFSASTGPNGGYLYAGGPICAASWCPNQDNSSSTSIPRFLALSTWRPVDDNDPIGGEKKAFIQIWSYDVVAKFRFGIAHTHGAVRSLLWCPSGNSVPAKQKYLSRLGLLAAASSDGVIRLFSVCHPDHLQSNAVYLVKPARTLETGALGGGKPPDCLSISWYRGVGHRVIAAGFSSGLVALWDLAQEEDSLQRSGDKLFPYLTINAHMTMVTTVDLADKGCKSEPGFPALILTGSADRHCSVWDLDGGPAFTTVPVHSVKNSHVTDAKFVRSYPGGGNAVVAFDDVFRSSSTSVAALDFDANGSKAWPIASQNSPVWSLSYNPWLGSLIMGTGGGELVLYVGAKIGKPLEFDKDTSRRRAFLFRTEEVMDEGQPGGPSDTYLNFMDSPVNNLAEAQFDEQKAVRSSDKMTCEPLMRSSRIAVTRVCFNQDLSAVGLVFAGTESGIGRFLDVSSLRRSGDVQKAIKACRL